MGMVISTKTRRDKKRALINTESKFPFQGPVNTTGMEMPRYVVVTGT